MKENGSEASTADVVIASKFLEPVIEGVRQRYGGMILITELLSNRLGKPVSRYAVGRWLHADETKRDQPTLGIGLLLREVYNKHQRRILSPWNSTKRRRPRRTRAEVAAERNNNKRKEQRGQKQIRRPSGSGPVPDDGQGRQTTAAGLGHVKRPTGSNSPARRETS